MGVGVGVGATKFGWGWSRPHLPPLPTFWGADFRDRKSGWSAVGGCGYHDGGGDDRGQGAGDGRRTPGSGVAWGHLITPPHLVKHHHFTRPGGSCDVASPVPCQPLAALARAHLVPTKCMGILRPPPERGGGGWGDAGRGNEDAPRDADGGAGWQECTALHRDTWLATSPAGRGSPRASCQRYDAWGSHDRRKGARGSAGRADEPIEPILVLFLTALRSQIFDVDPPKT